MSKKNWGKNKSGLYSTMDGRSKFRGKDSYPKIVFLTVLSAIVIGLILIGLVTYPFLIKPWMEKRKKTDVPENTNIGVVETQSRPALTESINEYLFRRRYINQPIINDNEILITEGEDGTGNPKLTNAMIFDRSNKNGAQTISEIKNENGNFLFPQFNENWIVLVDAKEQGGGYIGAFNRKTKKYSKIKEYKGLAPKISLKDNKLVWFEQLYTDRSSVYIFDLSKDDLLSLELQNGLPFVYGGADLDGDTVVWAGLDSKDSSLEEMIVNNRGAIHSMNLSTGEKKIYEPGMYVYSPRVHGNTVAWIDTDGKVTSTLYISVDGGAPKKISSDVSGFDVGDGYVSYCQDGKMMAYFVDGNVSLEISKPGQKCFYIGDNDGFTLWYDVTQDAYQRDVVKYIELERDSWQR